MLDSQLTIAQDSKRRSNSPMRINGEHIISNDRIGVILQEVVIINVIDLVGHI